MKKGSVAKKLLDRYTQINKNLGVYDMPVNSFKWGITNIFDKIGVKPVTL
jgi:hypothetical protein